MPRDRVITEWGTPVRHWHIIFATMLRASLICGVGLTGAVFQAGALAVEPTELECRQGRVYGDLRSPNVSSALTALAKCLDATVVVKDLRRNSLVDITLNGQTFDQAVARLVRDDNYILRRKNVNGAVHYILSFAAAGMGGDDVPAAALPQPSPLSEAVAEPAAPDAQSEAETAPPAAANLGSLVNTALRSGDKDARLQAIEALAEHGGPQAEAILQRLARDPDEDVRRLADSLMSER